MKTVKRAWGESDEEADDLLVESVPLELEVLLERHACGTEDHRRHAQPERACGNGWDLALSAALEHEPPRVHREQVQTVHEYVCAIEEGIDVARLDRCIEGSKIKIGCDVAGELCEQNPEPRSVRGGEGAASSPG